MEKKIKEYKEKACDFLLIVSMFLLCYLTILIFH